MSKRVLLAATVALCALCAGEARAGFLVQNFVGKTADGSEFDGVPIPVGTPFEIHSTFDTTPFDTETGAGAFEVVHILVVVDGVSFVAEAPEFYAVVLADPSSAFGANLSALITLGSVLAPLYGDATPPFDPQAPTPTVFSSYLGEDPDGDSEMFFLTPSDQAVVLRYSPDDGIASSITGAVPEPATFVSAGIAGVVGVAIAVGRRRRRAA